MSIIATIGSTQIVLEGSPNLQDRIDQRTQFSLTVIDQVGTALFEKGQPVTITDSILGVLFTGFVNQPSCQLLYPSTQKLWTLACVDNTSLLDNPTSNKTYTNQFAGTIVVDQIQRYAAADGVTCAAALRWDQQLTEWQQGTLSGTIAATNATDGNPGDGDLELAAAGSQVVVSGSGSGFSLANGLKLTGYCSSGYSTAYVYLQIWTGSLTIANVDEFAYDIWISSDSPAIKAGVDFICSDGTVLPASNTDQQGMSMSPGSADLSGLASDTWYRRTTILTGGMVGKTIVAARLALGGTNAGTYTAYFRRIAYTTFTPTTVTTNIFWDTSTLSTVQTAANIGYTNVALSQVQVEDKSVIRTHSALNIGAASIVQNSQMSWTQTNPLPSGCSLLRETSIDSGASWQAMTSGQAIPNLTAGMVVTGRTVQYRDTLTCGKDPTAIFGTGGPKLTVNSAYASAKTDVIQSYTTATDFATGTLTNLVTVGSGATPGVTLNQVARNWDDANISSQSTYGSGFTQIINKQQLLNTSASSDLRLRMDFAGQWQNFTTEVDVTILSSAVGGSGLVWRTTGWQNNNDTYAYMCQVSPTFIQMGKGTNSSSGAGSFTQLGLVSSLNFTANSVHRLKVVVNGNNHQIYVDNVLYLNVNDSTYTAAGYVGLRLYNSSGATITSAFDNFGVCAALSGSWQSPSVNIAGATTYGNSAVFWDIDGLPDSTTSITAQTSIDGGSTFQSVANGGAIPNLTAGQSLSGKSVILKLTLTASNAPVVPVLNGVSVWVMGQYSSSGTRTTTPIAWDSATRANQSGLGTSTDGQTYTQVGTGTTAIASNEATISNTTGDVHEVLGSHTLTDQEATVRFSLSASTISGGVDLRYQDANDFYRLAVSTTTVSLIKVSGGVSITLASVSMAISIATFYRLRFRVVGSGASAPVNLYGNAWLDGTTEPTTWTITAID